MPRQQDKAHKVIKSQAENRDEARHLPPYFERGWSGFNQGMSWFERLQTHRMAMEDVQGEVQTERCGRVALVSHWLSHNIAWCRRRASFYCLILG